MSNINQAIVMAAGFGKRMLPITEVTPKPIIDINGKSLIENILENLYKNTIYKIVINTHYLSDKIENHVRSLPIYSKLDIKFLHEEEILNSGGGVVNALQFFDDKPFYRFNSDIFWQDEIIEILRDGWQNDYDALLGVMHKYLLIGYEGAGDFNLVNNKFIKLDNNKDYVFSGISIFSPKLFRGIDKKPFNLFKDYIFKDKLMNDGILDQIYGVEFKTKIYHVDNIINLNNLRKKFAEN